MTNKKDKNKDNNDNNNNNYKDNCKTMLIKYVKNILLNKLSAIKCYIYTYKRDITYK